MLHCSQSYILLFSFPLALMQARVPLTAVYYLTVSFPASAAWSYVTYHFGQFRVNESHIILTTAILKA